MMVTSMFISELEAIRSALAAERARIREEYETRLPGGESTLAAADQLSLYGMGQTAEAVLDVPEAGQAIQVSPEGAQDAPGPPVAILAAPPLADAVTDDVASMEDERPTPAPPSRRPNWRRELAGLRQEPAAIKIAERTGGTVTVSEIALVFMEVGLTRATGNLAKGQASTTLSESTRFERIGRGAYRLIPEPTAAEASEPVAGGVSEA